jgi:hypothetical protein
MGDAVANNDSLYYIQHDSVRSLMDNPQIERNQRQLDKPVRESSVRICKLRKRFTHEVAHN